jgi:uncharacterized protein (TIGR04255 family)
VALAVIDRDNALPDYTNPPVEETALSIQFAPIQKFGAPHFGLFWAQIRNEFELFSVQAPIANETEQFDISVRHRPHVGFQLLTEPDLRCWFLDKSENRLIQIQRDRFVHNWRRVTGTEAYPRYPQTRETLLSHWVRFLSFLKSENLDSPEVNQCEVNYVNHIALGSGWRDYGELNKVVAPWSGKLSGEFLPHPERVTMEMHYLLPEKLGRLHISLVPVIRARDMQEVLQMSLVARGAPKSSNIEDIMSWIDLGREWVVKGFSDITTQTMHKIWGRRP